MIERIKRRDLITLLGGAAATPLLPPLAARAQQAMLTIGFLSPTSAGTHPYLDGLRQGLKETGYVEGQNLAIEYRWGEGQFDRLPALAADLVSRQVAVIVAAPAAATLAAKAATATIPIIFQIGGDPVQAGLVASYNRPAGNATGVSQLSGTLVAKRLELLHELAPNATLFAAFVNPPAPTSKAQATALQEAAQALGLRVLMVPVANEREFVPAFETIAEQQAQALIVTASAFFVGHRAQIAALAARHRIPAVYESREFVIADGLMSYGTDFLAVYRQIGLYVGRILKGEKPAALPVVQPTKFDLVINLKTARALKLDIPPKLLALADEVIE